MKFNELGLHDSLIEGIEALGFETPTPIQEQTIPIILQGKDIIASAQTGTGKTAAFLLPIIQKLLDNKHTGSVGALIIVPTRELAMQIDQMMEGLSYFTPINSIAVYGGNDGTLFSREKDALSTGVDMVISTPGRLIAHLNMKYVSLEKLQFLVLDEADRMLDMGFYDDIMKIISHLPQKRQNLMFSATMPPKIRELARKTLQHPSEINIAVSKPAARIKQEAFVVFDHQKDKLVKHIIKEKNLKSILIFCSTKSSVKLLSRDLKRSGVNVEEFHSDLEQIQRQKVLLQFKNKRVAVLVATDIMSRGIDIEDIDLVINYDVPHDGEDYIHRIGRTARAESKGEAITLINEKEQNRFLRIEKLIDATIEKTKVPEFFGEVPEYNPRPAKYRQKPGKKSYYKKGKKIIKPEKKQ